MLEEPGGESHFQGSGWGEVQKRQYRGAPASRRAFELPLAPCFCFERRLFENCSQLEVHLRNSWLLLSFPEGPQDPNQI